jgi:hypothetical protein
MTEKETMTIKISFNAEIDPKSFDEISRIVSNHLDYMIAFDDYPEIKAYFNAKVEIVK